MITLYDQVGNKVELPQAATRIVSLVPSITDLLAYFHLDKETVGITKFCVLPKEWYESKTRIGGTKQIDIAKIRSLKPDLIIANKEENVKEQVEALANNFPVYISDVDDTDSALQMMEDISMLTGKQDEGLQLARSIRERFAAIPKPIQTIPVCYLIWQKPYMTIGGDTFINAILELTALQNVFKNQSRYPEVSPESILASGCQHVLLSSEPFPFQQKHANELREVLSAFSGQYPQATIPAIHLVDGQLCSWYGPRMLEAAGYLENLQRKLLSIEHI